MKLPFTSSFGVWLSGQGFCLAMLLLASCKEPPSPTSLSNWKQFSPPGGNFTVLMPPDPVEVPPKTKTGFESKTYGIMSALSNLAALAVSYSDQPPQGTFEAEPEKILNVMRDHVVGNLRGELISETRITLQGYPGRELKISVPGGHSVIDRIYLVNKRLYSLMARAGAKGLDSPDAKAFFDSFKILQ